MDGIAHRVAQLGWPLSEAQGRQTIRDLWNQMRDRGHKMDLFVKGLPGAHQGAIVEAYVQSGVTFGYLTPGDVAARIVGVGARVLSTTHPDLTGAAFDDEETVLAVLYRVGTAVSLDERFLRYRQRAEAAFAEDVVEQYLREAPARHRHRWCPMLHRFA